MSGIFKLSPKFLAVILDLPSGTDITDAGWDAESGDLLIYFEHPDVPNSGKNPRNYMLRLTGSEITKFSAQFVDAETLGKIT